MKRNYYNILGLENFESNTSIIENKFKQIPTPSSEEIEAYHVLKNKNTKDHYDLILLNREDKLFDFKSINNNVDNILNISVNKLEKVAINSTSIFIIIFIFLVLLALVFAISTQL
ncbi:MAG: hypothetical protein KGZ74_04600 [Chitinophagaceae bacterium]|nr:hypothetical protein [Chitinophagaceae bacterium]